MKIGWSVIKLLSRSALETGSIMWYGKTESFKQVIIYKMIMDNNEKVLKVHGMKCSDMWTEISGRIG